MVAELAVVGVERRPDADLRTLATNRPLIRVRVGADDPGVLYDLAAPDDMSVIRYQRIHQQWRRVLELSILQATRTVYGEPDADGKPTVLEPGYLTFGEEESWQRMIDAISEAIVFSVPPDVEYPMTRAAYAGYGPWIRYKIAEVFFLPPKRPAMPAVVPSAATQTEAPAEPTPISDRPAGRKRSRASKGSTAEATPSNG